LPAQWKPSPLKGVSYRNDGAGKVIAKDADSNELTGLRESRALGLFVTEKFLAFVAKKSADDGDVVIALFEHEPAGDQARSPFINFVAVLAAVSVNVFLGDAIDDGANLGPHAGTGTHGAGLVR